MKTRYLYRAAGKTPKFFREWHDACGRDIINNNCENNNLIFDYYPIWLFIVHWMRLSPFLFFYYFFRIYAKLLWFTLFFFISSAAFIAFGSSWFSLSDGNIIFRPGLNILSISWLRHQIFCSWYALTEDNRAANSKESISQPNHCLWYRYCRSKRE